LPLHEPKTKGTNSTLALHFRGVKTPFDVPAKPAFGKELGGPLDKLHGVAERSAAALRG
jgi:hypothetical protein